MQLFVQAAIGVHNETNDVFIMPASSGKSAPQEYEKVLSKIATKDDLFISYEESAAEVLATPWRSSMLLTASHGHAERAIVPAKSTRQSHWHPTAWPE